MRKRQTMIHQQIPDEVEARLPLMAPVKLKSSTAKAYAVDARLELTLGMCQRLV